MLRRPTFWFVTLAVCVGMVLFRIKYEVIALEQHNTRLKKELNINKDAIHHLKAEWTHLNDPVRLQKSSKQHLAELRPVISNQLITFQDMAGSDTAHKPHAAQQQTHTNTPTQNALDAYVANFETEANEGVQA